MMGFNMIDDSKKVGARLNYSDSRLWHKLADAAVEDIGRESSSDLCNVALVELVDSMVGEKKYDHFTGSLQEDISFRNDKEKEEFWQNEYEALIDNIIEDYEQLKQNIIDGVVSVKSAAPKGFMNRISAFLTKSTSKILPVATRIFEAKAEVVHTTDTVTKQRDSKSPNASKKSGKTYSSGVRAQKLPNVSKKQGTSRSKHAGRF